MLKTQQQDALDRLATAELLQELKNLGNAVAGLRQGAINNVLTTEFAKFPSDGVITRTFPVPFASIALYNHSALAAVIIDNSPPGPYTVTDPPFGLGVHQVDGAKHAIVNMRGSTVTFYGQADGTVSFQIFDKSQAPSYS